MKALQRLVLIDSDVAALGSSCSKTMNCAVASDTNLMYWNLCMKHPTVLIVRKSPTNVIFLLTIWNPHCCLWLDRIAMLLWSWHLLVCHNIAPYCQDYNYYWLCFIYSANILKPCTRIVVTHTSPCSHRDTRSDSLLLKYAHNKVNVWEANKPISMTFKRRRKSMRTYKLHTDVLT